jgi:predicted DNA-binding protein (MmcQ/YjbR family)
MAKMEISVCSSPEDFADLVECLGCRPAPYLARAQWIAIEADHDLSPRELTELLRRPYDLIFAKLPRKKRQEVSADGD